MGGSKNRLPHRRFWICAEHRRNISRSIFEEDNVVAVDARTDPVTQLGALAIAGRAKGHALTLCPQLAHESQGAHGAVSRDVAGNGF